MKQFFFIVLLTIIYNFGFGQSINYIRKQKIKSEKEIKELNNLLKETKKDKNLSSKKVSIIDKKISENKNILKLINKEISYYDSSISKNERYLSELEKDRKDILKLYSNIIYAMWKKDNKNDNMMFIFSSNDLLQAYRRFKYFEQIQKYSKKQFEKIKEINDSIKSKNDRLKEFNSQKKNALNKQKSISKDLKNEKLEQNKLIKSLSNKEKQIKRKLDNEIKNRIKLESELKKLIAKATRKSGSKSKKYKLTPKEKTLSSEFSKNKGKLPWPVKSGFISEKFGINTNPIYKRVKMVNNGVTISTSKNSKVMCVFKGVVSEIMFMKGYNNIIIVRHGEYLTVYSNLIDVNVKKGDTVDTKDILGKLDYDNEKGSTTNFQIWKNTTKINPQEWLSK